MSLNSLNSGYFGTVSGDSGIRGFGDAIYVRIRYMGISQYALLCSAADAFSHGFE